MSATRADTFQRTAALAWAVSQHTVTSKNTQARADWNVFIHCVIMRGLPLAPCKGSGHNSIHPPQMEIYSQRQHVAVHVAGLLKNGHACNPLPEERICQCTTACKLNSFTEFKDVCSCSLWQGYRGQLATNTNNARTLCTQHRHKIKKSDKIEKA